MNGLGQRRSLVTGAASGLGFAIVEQLVASGATVLGLDLPGRQRSEIVTAAGAEFVGCDVSQTSDWGAVAERVRQGLGGLDLVALNAGVMTRSPTDAIDTDPLDLAGSTNYRRVFSVNVDGVVFGLAALRGLLAPGASVAITASTAGLGGLPFDPYYSMTKHAIIGFVRSMAGPLADSDIRINALCPGGIDTAIVPDALRAVAADRLRPAHAVARALLAMAEQPSSGGTWLLGTDDQPVVAYVVPQVD